MSERPKPGVLPYDLLANDKEHFEKTFIPGNTFTYEEFIFTVVDVIKEFVEGKIVFHGTTTILPHVVPLFAEISLEYIRASMDYEIIRNTLLDCWVQQARDFRETALIKSPHPLVAPVPPIHPSCRSIAEMPDSGLEPFPGKMRIVWPADQIKELKEENELLDSKIRAIMDVWRQYFRKFEITDDPELCDGDELSNKELYSFRYDIESILWPELFEEDEDEQ